jgi:hypothetical protein
MMADALDKAIEAWAKKYAALYEKHGRAEGGPETWCNEIMLEEGALEDRDICDALQAKLEAAFLQAVKSGS